MVIIDILIIFLISVFIYEYFTYYNTRCDNAYKILKEIEETINKINDLIDKR